MQLLVEPFIEADGADSFKIAGARAEGEAIEGMEDTIVAAELGGLVFGACLRLGGQDGLLALAGRNLLGSTGGSTERVPGGLEWPSLQTLQGRMAGNRGRR